MRGRVVALADCALGTLHVGNMLCMNVPGQEGRGSPMTLITRDDPAGSEWTAAHSAVRGRLVALADRALGAYR